MTGITAIRGQGASDTIIGSAGNDTIYGGSANDVITGGFGDDTLNGDGDNDSFYYSSTGNGFDNVNGGTGTDTIGSSRAQCKVIGLSAISAVEAINANGFIGVDFRFVSCQHVQSVSNNNDGHCFDRWR